MKPIWCIVCASFFSYALVTISIYYLSDYWMFPIPKPSYQTLDSSFTITSLDGTPLTVVYMENTNAQYTILYSHGNGEDLGIIMPVLKDFVKHGFSVFAYDYRGYGTSQGVPSETNSYLDIQLAYRYLTQIKKIPAKNIILYGRSIGSGPSVDLATQFPIAALILENPLVSVFRVVTGITLFPVDRFRNSAKIEQVKVPVLIMHSEQDQVVPFWQGQLLFKLIRSPKYFIAVPEAGHNNMIRVAGEKYWDNIQSFSESLK